MKSKSKNLLVLPLMLLSISLFVSSCNGTSPTEEPVEEPEGEDPTPENPDPENPDPENPDPEVPVGEEKSFGETIDNAVKNNLQITLSSSNVISDKYVISVSDSINVAELNEGAITSTSKSFSKYYVSKGMVTDGKYIYTILNAKTGSTKSSGFDVGIIAKLDTKGAVLAHTSFAYHWGNVPRLSYFNGKLFVSRTSDPSSSDYGGNTSFANYVLEFNAESLTYSNRTASADFSIPSFEISDAGVFDMISVNKENTQCALIYKNEGSYYLYTYQKNDSETFEKVANGVELPTATDGETTSNNCYDVHVSDNYVYTMWSIAKGGVIRVSDLEGNIILDKTVDNPQEGTHTKKNYQGITEIDNVLYYSICDWSDSKNAGFMLFKVEVTCKEKTALTVSFDTNGADVEIPAQSLYVGEKVTKPADPTYSYTDKRGKVYEYVFENWYSGEKVWDFDNDVVKEDTTLKANYTFQDTFFMADEHASERTANTKTRIMSFNVLSADWNNKPAVDDTRANQVFDTIERYQPDVVGLQEFDSVWYSKASTLLDGFSIVNKDNNIIGTTVNYTTLAYNTETVSLLEYSQTNLPTCSTKKCRNVIIAAFEFIKGDNIGKQFLVSNTHWNRKESERILQASETFEIITGFKSKYSDAPIFVTGDYNSHDEYESIATFESVSGYTDSKKITLDADVVCDTYHIGTPMREGDVDYSNPNHVYRGPASFGFKNVQTDSSLDHIFVSNDITVLFYNTVHDEVVLNGSDHCPIYIDATF